MVSRVGVVAKFGKVEHLFDQERTTAMVTSAFISKCNLENSA